MSRLLVVDDDIQMLSALEAALRHKGHLVETASNGIDAAAKLETSAYPRSSRHHRLENAGLDGIELLNHVRRTKPGVPVIVLTAFGTVQTAVEEMKAGDITGFANAGSFFEQPERNGRRYLEQSFHSVRWNDLGCIQ